MRSELLLNTSGACNDSSMANNVSGTNFKTNEVGIYSLANYFASSEFSEHSTKSKIAQKKNRIKNKTNVGARPTQRDRQHVTRASPEILPRTSEKMKTKTPLSSLHFYQGNNLIPLKFNDAFKLNFKNMNLFSPVHYDDNIVHQTSNLETNFGARPHGFAMQQASKAEPLQKNGARSLDSLESLPKG